MIRDSGLLFWGCPVYTRLQQRIWRRNSCACKQLCVDLCTGWNTQCEYSVSVRIFRFPLHVCLFFDHMMTVMMMFDVLATLQLLFVTLYCIKGGPKSKPLPNNNKIVLRAKSY